MGDLAEEDALWAAVGPRIEAAAAAAERGTNPGGGESGDVASVRRGWARMGWLARTALTASTPRAQVHGRCAELWRWMLGRPEEEIVLVSHESLLFHMLNFGCAWHILLGSVGPCVVWLWALWRGRVGWQTLGFEAQHLHRRWLSDPSAPIPARPAGARSSRRTTSAG